MAMAWLWTGMLVLSLLFGMTRGTLDAVANAALEGADSAVQLCLSMAGILCLWSGVMEIMNACGLSKGLSGIFRPLLRRLLPNASRDEETLAAISAKVAANFFGLGNAATPLGLILLGASLNFSNFKNSLRNLSISVICRLVINPAILIALAIALGFRGVELCAVLVVFAVPVSVNSYTLAMQLDGDYHLAGSIVLISTALSCFTLCGWVWLLKSFSLL